MPMTLLIVLCCLFPFLMTVLGAAAVFLCPRGMHPCAGRIFLGFAAGVMLAASVWSLLNPAIAAAEEMGLPGWLPASVGVVCGVLFLLGSDLWAAREQPGTHAHKDGTSVGDTFLLQLAMTVHNIPEGMAVGLSVALAAKTVGAAGIPDHAALSAAVALSLGIGIQNLPEGAAALYERARYSDHEVDRKQAEEFIRRAKEVRTVTEDMPVNQGKLTIGFRSGVTLSEPEYPAMMMFNEIFGGGVTSKLFMNVREKMSLCYYCSSAPDATKGLMIVSSGIEVEKREIAEKAIFDQLDAVKRGDFTEDEQNSALLSLINGYRELSDSARGLETWYLGRLLEGMDNDPDDVVESLKAVTREQILAAANRVSCDTIYFLNGTLKGEDDGDDE